MDVTFRGMRAHPLPGESMVDVKERCSRAFAAWIAWWRSTNAQAVA